MTRRLESRVLLAFATLVSRAVLLYPGSTMADPDSVAMTAGMVLRLRSNLPPAEAMFYGRTLSPGTYALVDGIGRSAGLSPAHLTLALDVAAGVASVVAVLAFVDVLQHAMPRGRALFAGWLLAFAPLSWSASLSFHPVVPALALVLVALALAVRALGGAGHAGDAASAAAASGGAGRAPLRTALARGGG